jgi:hypothetical protein
VRNISSSLSELSGASGLLRCAGFIATAKGSVDTHRPHDRALAAHAAIDAGAALVDKMAQG